MRDSSQPGLYTVSLYTKFGGWVSVAALCTLSCPNPSRTFTPRRSCSPTLCAFFASGSPCICMGVWWAGSGNLPGWKWAFYGLIFNFEHWDEGESPVLGISDIQAEVWGMGHPCWPLSFPVPSQGTSLKFSTNSIVLLLIVVIVVTIFPEKVHQE